MINNRCHIEGYLGADPEMRYLPSGAAVTTMRVGVSEYKGKDKEKETQWFTVKFFGKIAESVNEYLEKGILVTVDGRMNQYQWEDKEGVKRYGFEIVGEDFKSYKTTGGNGGNGGARPAAKKAAPAKRAPVEDEGDDYYEGDSDEGFPLF